MHFRYQRLSCLLGCSSKVPGTVLKHRHFLPNSSGGQKAKVKVLASGASVACMVSSWFVENHYLSTYKAFSWVHAGVG